MRLDHATLKCSPQSLCRVSSCWKRGGRQAPQPLQGELIVKPWCKIELHFHDPQTGHGYVALSSLESRNGTEWPGLHAARLPHKLENSARPQALPSASAQFQTALPRDRSGCLDANSLSKPPLAPTRSRQMGHAGPTLAKLG